MCHWMTSVHVSKTWEAWIVLIILWNTLGALKRVCHSPGGLPRITVKVSPNMNNLQQMQCYSTGNKQTLTCVDSNTYDSSLVDGQVSHKRMKRLCRWKFEPCKVSLKDKSQPVNIIKLYVCFNDNGIVSWLKFVQHCKHLTHRACHLFKMVGINKIQNNGWPILRVHLLLNAIRPIINFELKSVLVPLVLHYIEKHSRTKNVVASSIVKSEPNMRYI